MPFYVINGTPMHVKLSGKAKKNPPKHCCGRTTPANPIVPSRRCAEMATLLCDWPLEAGGTCDAPLCPEHATEVGPDRHYCPTHAKLHREREPELF